MSKTVFIPEFDEDQMETGHIWVTKVTEARGAQRGLMPLAEVTDVLSEIFGWGAERLKVQLISRFAESPYIAIGQNGAKWTAVKELPPAEYFLTMATGQAFKVRLPRLVAKVSNHGSSYLFWTADDVLTPESKLYPLIIGNISSNGWICIGSTGIKCAKPDDIDKFVRQVIEAPTTGTYIPEGVKVEQWFHALTERWDESVGQKHPIMLGKLISRQD